MIWQEDIECKPLADLKELQSERLVTLVQRAYEKVPFYKHHFDAYGVHPEDIESLKDIPSLPFTTKSHLRDNYPYGLCAVPPSDIVRMHASSGTTGKPTPVYYTKKDLEKWVNSMTRSLYTAGIREDDVCQIAFRYSLFTGAFGHHQAAERIGAMVIPTSSGQTERQILMMQDFEATVIHCTPSYAITIAEKMIEMANQRLAQENLEGKCSFLVEDINNFKSDSKFDISIAMGLFDYTKDPLPILKKMQELTILI